MAEKSRESISGNTAAWRRFVPPAGFVLALMLLVVFCYDASYSALPPTEKRYVKAKKRIDELKTDTKRGNLRQSWEDLIREFRAIYECDPAWPNRPAALFRAAESLEELSHRSYRAADMHKAVACYEDVAARHPKSCLADDALYRAAQMRAVWLKDDAGALALLRRIQKKYPDGDMAGDAAAFERVITAAGKGRTSSEAGSAVRAASRAAREDVPLSPPQDTADARRSAPPAKTSLALIPAADIPARYADAKKRMAALLADRSRSCLRQPWQELQGEFFLIATSVKKMTGLSEKSPLQAIGGGAQYRAATCNDAIAASSGLMRDHEQSQDLYVSVADAWPKSALADDALLRAAIINAEKLDRHTNSRLLLERIIASYPTGDMTAQARTMLGKEARADAKRNDAPPNRPVLNGISWNSPSRDRVEIVLEMNAPAEWQARLEKVGAKRAPQLVVSLNGVRVSKNASRGVKIRDSLLTEIGIAPEKDASVLRFDLRDESRYAIRRDEKNGIRISLAAAEQKPAPPVISPDRVRGTKVNDMARQLGLSVHTVFIDAGHGGRDPGTSHNGILERAVSLDVAKTLGRLLEANGLQVVYSRTEDIALPLSRRTALANAAKADLFVSVHVNANDDPSVQGIETYYLDLARSPQAARVAALENAGSDRRLGDMQTVLADVMLNARIDESQRLARDIQRLTISRLKRSKTPARSNGIKSAPFHVLIGAQMPAILVEIGYCTNVDEAARLKSPRYRLHLAEGLAEGILAYRDRLLHRHVAGNSLTPNEAGAI